MKVFKGNFLALEKAVERIALFNLSLMRRKRRCGLSVIPMCAGKWEKAHLHGMSRVESR